ncbi:MAG: FAD-dependent oxidoreductase [Deltaproteobacteria bacterium]|nr:FAD-dependent oxidoreductase [Deltaproteobacteria bacterium]
MGGGLTGISAALHLRRPWVLFEKETRLGGLVVTRERDGHFFDRTGHWLHLRDDGSKHLAAETLPGQMVEVERRARIFSHGATTLYPFQANLYGLPPEVVKECLLGVIEAKYGPGGPEPKNFEEYCLRHFGKGISKHFMIPYNERLWGVSPREITAAWCSRFVPLPNLEQVVAGAVGANAGTLGYNATFSYPKQGGIQTFSEALAARLDPTCVHTRASLDQLDYRRREVTVGGERLPYVAVVATLPLPELLRRMPGLPADIEQHASRLRCTTLRYLDLATRTRPLVDWHWVYVPEARFPFYRVGVYSNAAASMAPPGRGSFYVELADRGPVSETTVRASVHGLVAMGAIASPDDVLFADARAIEYAYVVFDDHYYAATRAIFAFLEAHGVFPRGRYGGWTYNAMEDALIAGREVAAAIDGGSLGDKP